MLIGNAISPFSIQILSSGGGAIIPPVGELNLATENSTISNQILFTTENSTVSNEIIIITE